MQTLLIIAASILVVNLICESWNMLQENNIEKQQKYIWGILLFIGMAAVIVLSLRSVGIL